jgi:hypothetical protein
MSSSILNSSNDSWDDYLRRFPVTTQHLHYTAAYHRLMTANGDGEAQLFVFEEGENLYFYPFMLRTVPSIGDAMPPKNYHDIASVFGYTGPQVLRSDPGFCEKARQSLDDYLRSIDCISELVRFDPVLANHSVVAGSSYHLVDVKPYVYVSLTYPEDMLQRYDDRLRTYIKRAERRFGHIRITNTDDLLLDSFFNLYRDHMRTICAAEYYLFSPPYFRALSQLIKTNGHLFYLEENGQIIAGLLFLEHNALAYYHHGARDTQCSQSSLANKYLFHKAFEYYHQQGIRVCLLGGGIGNSPGDPLLRFKKAYGGTTVSLIFGKRVLNTVNYAAICEMWRQAFPHLADKYASYIDKYRFRL